MSGNTAPIPSLSDIGFPFDVRGAGDNYGNAGRYYFKSTGTESTSLLRSRATGGPEKTLIMDYTVRNKIWQWLSANPFQLRWRKHARLSR